MMFETMLKLLFTRLELYLLKNQKKFVMQYREVETESSGSNNEEHVWKELLNQIQDSKYYTRLFEGTLTKLDKKQNESQL